jgi:uncharacterized membrane protein
MTYKSKRTITSIAAGILFLAAYLVYALGKNSPAPENLKSWALVMLVFIAIGVVTQLIIQILFHIAFSIAIAVKEQESDDKEVERLITSAMVEDEMDKLISLKSAHVGYICAGIGFIAFLVTLAFGAPAVFPLHILFGSFFAGTIADGCVGVYCYETGVRNG